MLRGRNEKGRYMKTAISQLERASSTAIKKLEAMASDGDLEAIRLILELSSQLSRESLRTAKPTRSCVKPEPPPEG